jgi:hypothetical protein
MSSTTIAFNNTMVDAFGRLKVSNPATLFDSKQLVDNQPLYWDDSQVSGSGTSSTYNTNQASTTLAVTNATAGRRVRQTRRRFNYQPGKAQLIFMTGVLGANGATKRIGYFDDNNGLYFQRGTNLSVNVRTYTSGSPVNTSTPQSSWNLDTMDGNGSSGINLDTTKTQIYVIAFEWLGVGSVLFGIVNNAQLYWVHRVDNANINPVVYMSTPNLPLRYEIINDGDDPADSITHICSSVISEGGAEDTGAQFAVDTLNVPVSATTQDLLYPLLAVRLKSTHLAGTIKLRGVSVLCSTASFFRYALVLNPTVTGTALSFSSITNSCIEVARPTNATTLTSGTGTLLYSGYANQGTTGDLNVVLPDLLTLGAGIDGTADIAALFVQKFAVSAETYYASLRWTETI